MVVRPPDGRIVVAAPRLGEHGLADGAALNQIVQVPRSRHIAHVGAELDLQPGRCGLGEDGFGLRGILHKGLFAQYAGSGVEAGQGYGLVCVGHGGDDDQVEVSGGEHVPIVFGRAGFGPELAGGGEALVVEVADRSNGRLVRAQCFNAGKVDVGLGAAADHSDTYGAI